MAVQIKTDCFVTEKVTFLIRWARNELGDEVIPETLLQHTISRAPKLNRFESWAFSRCMTLR